MTWIHGYIVILFFVDRALSVIATLYNVITVRFTLQIHLPLTNGQYIQVLFLLSVYYDISQHEPKLLKFELKQEF